MMRAYPVGLRREFGADMFQLLVDRHRRDGVSVWRLLVSELGDAVVVAPRLRWEESLMSRFVMIGVAGAAALLAGIAVGPAATVPVVAGVLLVVVAAMRRSQPLPARGLGRRPVTLLLAGLACLTVAVVLGLTAQHDLGEVAWALFTALSIVGTLLTLIGGVATLTQRGAVAPPAT